MNIMKLMSAAGPLLEHAEEWAGAFKDIEALAANDGTAQAVATGLDAVAGLLWEVMEAVGEADDFPKEMRDAAMKGANAVYTLLDQGVQLLDPERPIVAETGHD